MNAKIKRDDVKPIILLALREDIGQGDVTSRAIFSGEDVSEAVIIAKEKGIFCGGDIVKYIFEEIDSSLGVDVIAGEGYSVKKGEILLRVKGNTGSILTGERTVLNFLGRMCGVATRTNELVSLLNGTSIKILDTRKTMPGFRMLDKYAVRAGGGENHRMGLFDMVLIKDNHIKAAGGIAEAVAKTRKAYGDKYKIEVETTNIDEVREALSQDIDIIMLDNMDKKTMKKAVNIIDGKKKIDASGNMDKKKIRQIRDQRIDYISIGAITHSVKALDLSMKFY